jgi:uncharacterized protein
MSTHPKSNPEDEYFARENAELIKQQRAKLDEQRKATERKAHYGKCPRCGADLQEKEFHHVKIDVCNECGGTWLDKGELQMLTHVERNGFSRFIGDMLGLDKR